MSGLRGAGDKLVHDAATGTDKFVFSTLTDLSQFYVADGNSRIAQQRAAYAYF